jgi:apolipoprotein N-acyltransferase
LLNYLAQPPVQIPILAWISCGVFAWIVALKKAWSRRQWWITWVSASLMWLMLLQGIRLAFWPLTAGWIALSLYLAVYFPISLAIARSLHHRYRFPLALACAIGWTSCELLRSYVITGFAPCALAHSQTPWPMVLQIASHFGGYGVGFMMMLTSAWIVDAMIMMRSKEPRSAQNYWLLSSLHSLVRTAIFVWVILSYGIWVNHQNYLSQIQPIKPLGRFLLVQDHMPTMFDATRESIEQGWLSYENTTQKAVESIRKQAAGNGKLESSKLDLIVWPESVYSGLAPTMFWDQGDSVPAALQMDRDQLEMTVENLDRANEFKLRSLRSALGSPLPNLLMGTDVIDIRNGAVDRYNSALWIGTDNRASDSLELDYYAKSHLVMFGEYIPILSWFPSIMQSIGLATLSSGKEPKAWQLASGRRVMANVCFEDTVPHLIRWQINRLTQQGKSPDVMINISNDGWFRGSSILDHHFNSAILAAVENRIPVLIASNTGITAWVDGDGQVVERLAKMDPGWILAQPVPDGRVGYWSYWGDLPAKLVTLVGLSPAMLAIVAKWRRRKSPSTS